MFISYFSEAVFGMAPFASGSFAELEMKIRSSDPVTVRGEETKHLMMHYCVQFTLLSILA